MGKIIAIDFDGTLFVEDWPNIGEPIIDVIESAKAEQRKGAKLILNTLREGKLLEDAVAACEKHGLKFDAVNDNLPEEAAKWGNNPRKIAATEYWDDRAVEFTKKFKTGQKIFVVERTDDGKICGFITATFLAEIENFVVVSMNPSVKITMTTAAIDTAEGFDCSFGVYPQKDCFAQEVDIRKAFRKGENNENKSNIEY